MARPSYFELLKDPRWQRKRLEALQLAEFKCEECGDGSKTLHVHHKLYRKGAMPWEYEDHELVTLCEDCHLTEHQIRSELAEVMALMTLSELDRVLGFAQGLKVNDGTLLEIGARSFEHAAGISAAIGPNDGEQIREILSLQPIDADRLFGFYKRRCDALPKP